MRGGEGGGRHRKLGRWGRKSDGTQARKHTIVFECETVRRCWLRHGDDHAFSFSFIPSYSGFKYENLTLTNVILAFLVIVLSIQSKIGIKVNIIVDRVNELWNGPMESDRSDCLCPSEIARNTARIKQYNI